MCARNFEPLNEAPDVASTLREEVWPNSKPHQEHQSPYPEVLNPKEKSNLIHRGCVNAVEIGNGDVSRGHSLVSIAYGTG